MHATQMCVCVGKWFIQTMVMGLLCVKQANLSESSGPGSHKRPKEVGVGGGDTYDILMI